MKLVKYFLQKKSVTLLLLVLILAGGLFSYIKMGKLEDAPFTINCYVFTIDEIIFFLAKKQAHPGNIKLKRPLGKSLSNILPRRQIPKEFL